MGNMVCYVRHNTDYLNFHGKNYELLPTHHNALMVGKLLTEIMEKIGTKAFNFNCEETEVRANDLISKGKYWVFVAMDTTANNMIGFVSLYESYALYASPYTQVKKTL